MELYQKTMVNTKRSLKFQMRNLFACIVEMGKQRQPTSIASFVNKRDSITPTHNKIILMF